jgi:hypothetical protein
MQQIEIKALKTLPVGTRVLVKKEGAPTVEAEVFHWNLKKGMKYVSLKFKVWGTETDAHFLFEAGDENVFSLYLMD